ncbi:MAG: hypothetical protein IKZ58_05580 [Selenomonadaceae bacterium]|nr:hypothetical protein [Selenomonadaceae bacterium]
MKTESLKRVAAIFDQIKGTFSRNKLKKIISLIMSISLWVYVMGAQNPVIEDSYRVKVNIKNNNSSKYSADYTENDAKIILSAPRSYFIDYSENDMRAYIDVTDYGEGEFDVPIEATYPKGFELIRISPENIHVKVEPIIEHQMELQVILSGSPKPNAVVKSIDAPKTVTIVGAKNFVESVTKVVGYVGIAGEDDDFELNVPMTAIDENGREVKEVRVVPASVNVFVDIEKGAKKTVPIVADITAPDGREISKITINPATIEIDGVEGYINAIDSLSTESVTIPDGQDTYKNYLNLKVPEGVVKLDAERIFVTVELKPLPVTNKTETVNDSNDSEQN